MTILKDYCPPNGFDTPLYFSLLKRSKNNGYSKSSDMRSTIEIKLFQSSKIKPYRYYRQISTIYQPNVPNETS